MKKQKNPTVTVTKKIRVVPSEKNSISQKECYIRFEKWARFAVEGSNAILSDLFAIDNLKREDYCGEPIKELLKEKKITWLERPMQTYAYGVFQKYKKKLLEKGVAKEDLLPAASFGCHANDAFNRYLKFAKEHYKLESTLPCFRKQNGVYLSPKTFKFKNENGLYELHFNGLVFNLKFGKDTQGNKKWINKLINCEIKMPISRLFKRPKEPLYLLLPIEIACDRITKGGERAELQVGGEYPLYLTEEKDGSIRKFGDNELFNNQIVRISKQRKYYIKRKYQLEEKARRYNFYSKTKKYQQMVEKVEKSFNKASKFRKASYHQISRDIVNYCKEKGINQIIISELPVEETEYKKRNYLVKNMYQLQEMLRYKCQIAGINIIKINKFEEQTQSS